MRAIWIDEPGDPDVLSYREGAQSAPQAGEALIKITAIGVNFIDVYYRTGLYPATYPLIPGVEMAGVVEAIGPGVADVTVGERVACVSACMGGYADYATVPATLLVPLSDAVDDQSAAAGLLQGMTAHVLSQSVYALQSGDTVLIHAAAGGVGLLLTQAARRLGARVIGAVSTEDKAPVAYAAGAHEVILSTQADVAAQARLLTKGEGVAVVYDSVGKDTFESSLDCLRPCGTLVLYGQSSGMAPPVDITKLARKSLTLTRPVLFDYIRDRPSLLTRARATLDWIATGAVQVRIWRTYALASAAQAHRDLESRATVGKLLLLPQ